MDATEQGGLREQIRAMAAGRGDGIDLDSPDRWVLEGVTNPGAFFRGLDALIPGDKRDPEQLRRLLRALENPDKLRMNWPWWKKALLFWKK